MEGIALLALLDAALQSLVEQSLGGDDVEERRDCAADYGGVEEPSPPRLAAAKVCDGGSVRLNGASNDGTKDRAEEDDCRVEGDAPCDGDAGKDVGVGAAAIGKAGAAKEACKETAYNHRGNGLSSGAANVEACPGEGGSNVDGLAANGLGEGRPDEGARSPSNDVDDEASRHDRLTGAKGFLEVW